jgi:hypothetical protein
MRLDGSEWLTFFLFFLSINLFVSFFVAGAAERKGRSVQTAPSSLPKKQKFASTVGNVSKPPEANQPKVTFLQ